MDPPPSSQTATDHAKIGRKNVKKYVEEQAGVRYRRFPIGFFAFAGSDFPIEIEGDVLDSTGSTESLDTRWVLGAFVGFVVFRQAPVAYVDGPVSFSVGGPRRILVHTNHPIVPDPQGALNLLDPHELFKLLMDTRHSEQTFPFKSP
jgi:hypothetical protein